MAFLNELQSKLLEAFSYLHDVCVANGLRYYACGGTLLGAVRHHGFIPWDDDIDVWMPRPDYEKLKVIMREKEAGGRYVFEAPGANDGHHYYAMGKLYDTTTTLVEKQKHRIRKGVFIDIFPLDGLGNSTEERDKRYKKMHLRNMMIASRISVPRKERSTFKNMAIRVSSLLPESVLDTRKVIERFDLECKKIPYENSRYVGVLMGSLGMQDVIEKEILQSTRLYDFETIQIYGTTEYDRLLTYIYNDWRKLPPVEKRVTLHDFEELDLHHGYLDGEGKNA